MSLEPGTTLGPCSVTAQISRNSAMALKGSTKDSRALARELGVSHLVTGSVRRSGDALRVTAELVEATLDAPIWSEKFSGTVEDVFGIQEEISRRIVAALEVKLTDREALQVAERPIDDAVAYDCYLRARHLMYGWTADATRHALRLVDEAIAVVGDNPLLLATKGQIYWTNANAMLAPSQESLRQASECVDRALVLDANAPHAIFVRGLIAGLRGQVEAALADTHRALALLPGDANVLVEICRLSICAGLRNSDGFVERLLQIDPLSPITPGLVSGLRIAQGRLEEAVLPARRAIERAPEALPMHILLAWWLARAGHREEASEILGQVGTAMAGTVNGSLAGFLQSALEGNAEAALTHVTSAMEQEVRSDVWTTLVADGYALLGRKADALRWVQIAIDCGYIDYPMFTRLDPFLASLREEPGFLKLMEPVRRRWEAVLEWERRLR